jgi:apolipoprotein N-acyltransferase
LTATRATRTVFDRAAAAVVVLWGWRRLTLAGLAGAASALALAPLHLLAVLFITLPVLVWLVDGTAARGPGGQRTAWPAVREAFFVGWSFGFGYFLAGLYWVGFALLVDAEQYAWALPLAVVALPAGLALFVALACALARLAWGGGYRRVVALAAAWTACEWLRSEILTGFPWNLIGQTLAGSDALIQPAAYVGDLGMSALVMLTAAAPATLTDRSRERTFLSRTLPSWLALLVLAGLWIAGAERARGGDEGTVPGVALRIVQPNIDQSAKWDPANRSPSIALYLELSDSATSPDRMGISEVTHLIWPETALPVLLTNEPQILAQIAALLPDQSHLVTGALRAEPASAGPDARYYNSVVVIDGKGRVSSLYDKRRLVPFGEFLPFQSWLERLAITQLTGVVGGFTAGGRGHGLMPAGAVPRFAPLICYEIVFTGDLFADGARPGWIVNVTNDAWFGNTSGPWQHLAQARLRAVEQGLPVIRAANTGISAVIDARGRIRHILGSGRRGVIDASLPAPIEPTFYATFGRLTVALVLVLAALWILLAKILEDRRGRLHSGHDSGWC